MIGYYKYILIIKNNIDWVKYKIKKLIASKLENIAIFGLNVCLILNRTIRFISNQPKFFERI